MIQDQHRHFLTIQANANKIRHSGRSLYDHLLGTHDLLQAWRNPPEICTAGLFHSIYGTRHFRHKTWPLEERNAIVQLIGPEAELLVYIFCVTARPRELIETTGRVFNTHKHELLMLSPATLAALLEIEAANLLEQGSHVGKWLKVLRTKDISDAAKRAIAQRMVDTGHTATSSAAPAPQ